MGVWGGEVGRVLGDECLIYSVVLVSDVQQNDSVYIHIFVCVYPFSDFFPL